MIPTRWIRTLNDEKLQARLEKLNRTERRLQTHCLVLISEIEERRLYAIEGFSSMYRYLVTKLNYSEATALKRIQVARTARRFPKIYKLLSEGSLSLSAVNILCPHLNPQNANVLLNRAQNASVREVERHIRKEFCETKKLHIEVDADDELIELVEQAKSLLSHKYPKGNLRDVLKEAMKALIRDQSPKGKPGKIKKETRYIPSMIKKAVWERDEGQCTYISPTGQRCNEHGFLEYDHIRPWAKGGSSLEVKNIRLLCRTHNRLMAEQAFGCHYVQRKIYESRHTIGELQKQDLLKRGLEKRVEFPMP